MSESKVRLEAKKLSSKLAGRPDLIEEFKAGFTEGMEEGINKQIDSLVAQQAQLTKFMDSVKGLSDSKKEKRKEAARKAAATRKANKNKADTKSEKTIKRHPASEQAVKLRSILKEPDTLVKVVKRIYGVAPSEKEASESMWFKTTDLVVKVWSECFDSKLSSKTTAQNIVRFIIPTLSKMESEGKAKRRGFAKHTRWLLIK